MTWPLYFTGHTSDELAISYFSCWGAQYKCPSLPVTACAYRYPHVSLLEFYHRKIDHPAAQTMCHILQGIVDNAEVRSFAHTVFAGIPATPGTCTTVTDQPLLEATVLQCLQEVWPIHSMTLYMSSIV